MKKKTKKIVEMDDDHPSGKMPFLLSLPPSIFHLIQQRQNVCCFFIPLASVCERKTKWNHIHIQVLLLETKICFSVFVSLREKSYPQITIGALRLYSLHSQVGFVTTFFVWEKQRTNIQKCHVSIPYMPCHLGAAGPHWICPSQRCSNFRLLHWDGTD